MDSQNRKVRIAALSVVSNTTLVVMKLAAGLAIGSVSIISEAIHSAVDLLAAVIALFKGQKVVATAETAAPYGIITLGKMTDKDSIINQILGKILG
jgi:divalent metal cation (Fe/Co/Zn/Cd) transporter